MSRTGLLLEKAGLAAVCSLVVCLLMLAGLGLFVDLDWGALPAVGRWPRPPARSPSRRMGLAIGALDASEVRAASLLA